MNAGAPRENFADEAAIANACRHGGGTFGANLSRKSLLSTGPPRGRAITATHTLAGITATLRESKIFLG